MIKNTLAAVLLGLFSGAMLPVKATTDNAVLTGVVTSEAEGAMEGVLVSAKRVGGKITVTVASNKAGWYAFPADRLSAGQYQLSIRAIGYEMANASQVATVGKGAARSDLRLQRTRDIASQLTDAEWLMSIPGTREQKQRLFVVCTNCHMLGHILKSGYD